jgi:hypothetical protein
VLRRLSLTLLAALVLAVAPGDAAAQGRGQAGGAPPQSGRAAAPRDLTGTWVSVVTEHWHLRMLVPPRGDFSMLPLNQEARRIANEWDAEQPPTGDDQCKPYGAAAIMRVPGRLNIHWADDNTLQMDIDSGTQTRMFHFNGAVPAGQDLEWQGYSVASWEALAVPTGRGRRALNSTQLKVTTTHMRPGFLRRNGIPYSESAVLEEWYDRFTEPNGDEWLVVTLIVTDPEFLTGPYVTSNHFRKIPDLSGWDPTPCQPNEAR